MENIKKQFYTVEIVNIVAFVNQLSKEKLQALPIKIRWNLKKGMAKIVPIAKEFNDFQNELVKELQDKYFTDEKSEEVIQPKLDNNGNVVKDADGNEETETIRRVKEEYHEEFQKAVDEINQKLSECASESNIVEIAPVDMDEFVENLEDDTPLEFSDLEMLSFLDETTNLYKEAE